MTNNFVNKKIAGSVVTDAAFGKTNSAHPGQNMGMSLEQVKKLVDNAEKVTGVTFTTTAGTVTPNIQLPSTAKYIKGIVFCGSPAVTDTFTLLINEERAIASAGALAYQATTGKPQKGYVDFFRPVASATAVTLNFTSIAGGTTVIFQVVYI